MMSNVVNPELPLWPNAAWMLVVFVIIALPLAALCSIALTAIRGMGKQRVAVGHSNSGVVALVYPFDGLRIVLWAAVVVLLPVAGALAWFFARALSQTRRRDPAAHGTIDERHRDLVRPSDIDSAVE